MAGCASKRSRARRATGRPARAAGALSALANGRSRPETRVTSRQVQQTFPCSLLACARLRKPSTRDRPGSKPDGRRRSARQSVSPTPANHAARPRATSLVVHIRGRVRSKDSATLDAYRESHSGGRSRRRYVWAAVPALCSRTSSGPPSAARPHKSSMGRKVPLAASALQARP
ncbi:MAG: hypothetical protein JWN04_899 [Myxococcaceae bacterium]|nr:hypothetical protein [Myxococcaceae bacterium]